MSILASNLKLLREEARLSVEEVAEKVNTTPDNISNWENGLTEPDNYTLEDLCIVLKMPYEDIRERDLKSERIEALQKMKKHDRNNYNWYFGDPKRLIFFISYIVYFIIGITVVTLISLFLIKEFNFETSYNELQIIGDSFKIYKIKTILSIVQNVLTPFIIGVAIFILIYLFKTYSIRVYWWYLFFFGFIITVLFIGSEILALPFFVYSIYKIIAKKY